MSEPDATSPPSEALNPMSAELHRLDSHAILDLFESDALAVPRALENARDAIVQLGEAMADTLRHDGRILYFGAGTSGRIGALDAAEWPPTFGIDPERIVATMAGGPTALQNAVEGAEDDRDAARTDVRTLQASPKDLWVGISASGSAAYVREVLKLARGAGARRTLITSHPTVGDDDRDLIAVRFDTGAEVLAGSTRLQAATATHQVLQRCSNLCAVRRGWVYAGRMVEMRPTNRKLRDRAERIVAELAPLPRDEAKMLLEACDDDIKCALVAARRGVSPPEAAKCLATIDRVLTQLPEFP